MQDEAEQCHLFGGQQHFLAFDFRGQFAGAKRGERGLDEGTQGCDRAFELAPGHLMRRQRRADAVRDPVGDFLDSGLSHRSAG